MYPLVSIITVCYNSEKTIRQAVESVLNQTYSNIEYIVVDGLSKDNTVSILHEYKSKFAEKNISYTIISERDKGIYDAMNKGIDLASGEIVGMINSDDWYEPIAAQKAAETYTKTKYDVMFGTVRLLRGDTDILKPPKVDNFYFTTRHWNHPTTFIAKSVYNQEKYSNVCVYDDYDLYLRLRRQNRKVVVIQDVLANFRVGGVSNEKTIAKAIERIKARYSVYRKNWYSRLYIIECIFMEMAKLILA